MKTVSLFFPAGQSVSILIVKDFFQKNMALLFLDQSFLTSSGLQPLIEHSNQMFTLKHERGIKENTTLFKDFERLTKYLALKAINLQNRERKEVCNRS